MNKEAIETYLHGLTGAEGSFPFGPDALVFKVMGKMFALVSQNETPARVTLKCDPMDGAMLTGQYEAIIPGYHMNKKHWITISLTGDVPEAVLKDRMEASYALIVSKLTKADKKKLGK